MADNAIRIEIRDLALEREQAERDLRETLGALEEKLLPRPAARRLMTEHDPALVLAGVLAAGVAIGLAGDTSRVGRLTSLLAAATAGMVAFRLTFR